MLLLTTLSWKACGKNPQHLFFAKGESRAKVEVTGSLGWFPPGLPAACTWRDGEPLGQAEGICKWPELKLSDLSLCLPPEIQGSFWMREGWENVFAFFLFFDLATCRGLWRRSGLCCRWTRTRRGHSLVSPLFACNASISLAVKWGGWLGGSFGKVLCIFIEEKWLVLERSDKPRLQKCTSRCEFWTLTFGPQVHRFTLDPFSDKGKAKYCPYPDTNNMASLMLLLIFRYPNPAALYESISCAKCN